MVVVPESGEVEEGGSEMGEEEEPRSFREKVELQRGPEGRVWGVELPEDEDGGPTSRYESALDRLAQSKRLLVDESGQAEWAPGVKPTRRERRIVGGAWKDGIVDYQGQPLWKGQGR